MLFAVIEIVWPVFEKYTDLVDIYQNLQTTGPVRGA